MNKNKDVFGMKIAVFLGMMVGIAGVAQAQSQAHEGHDMHTSIVDDSGMAPKSLTRDTSSTQAYKAADAQMHKAMMAAGYTGDADVDFLRNMIPHHQGAVEMAKIVLKYGTDADVRMLAGDILKAQDKEIRWMKDWLAKHGPTDAASQNPTNTDSSDARVELPVDAPAVKAVPTAVGVKAEVAEPLPVKEMVPATTSGTVVTSTVPPVDVISPTQALIINAVSATAMVMPDGLPAALTPDMPAPDEEIMNTAPKMEFLDGGK